MDEGAAQLTWLAAVWAELTQRSSYVAQLVPVPPGDGPLEIGGEVFRDVLCREPAGEALMRWFC